MSMPDHIAALPALAAEELQEEIAPVRVVVWKTSWVERITMTVAPMVLLVVFSLTNYRTDSEYSVCWDEAFFGTDSRTPIDAVVLPRYHLFGLVVSEPRPLISRAELVKLLSTKGDIKGKQFKPLGSVYPKSFIVEAGMSSVAYGRYCVILKSLLIGWSAVGLWNVFRYQMYKTTRSD